MSTVSLGACVVAALMVSWIPAGVAVAQDGVARVTLMAGTPRMVGESIRPLQAILTGAQLETGDADAIGLLIRDVVVHIGTGSAAVVEDEAGRKVIRLTHGYVVLYTEPGNTTEVVVITPLGRMVIGASGASVELAGRFSVRHDRDDPGIGPAVSTFVTIEGVADVEGTNPVAGPHVLAAQQRWQIVEGQAPGVPVDVDRADADAEALRDMLHRRTAELVQEETIDIASLVLEDLSRDHDWDSLDMYEPDGQLIIDVDTSIQKAIDETFVPDVEAVLRFAEPLQIGAGDPATADAQFGEVEGEPFTEDWNDYLTALNGMPAYQPTYATGFDNGGFSYLQFAGSDAQLTNLGGEQFLAVEQGGGTGWATYTPELALGGVDFDPSSRMVQVVSDGFRAIAESQHLPGQGTLGGGGDPDSGFLVVSGDNVQINPDLPSGYPQLDQAFDTTGLEVDGVAPSEQVAAIGSGLNPLNPAETGPSLLFVSDAHTDAGGNAFNFNGVAIEPTDLGLPIDRQVQEDTTGASSLAAPLATDGAGTVGIQFAASGDVIAIIHHAGSSGGSSGTVAAGDHFEVERGTAYTLVRWSVDGRVTGGDGEVLEAEDLNGDPNLRNELFAVIADEVNRVVPEGLHTVCGPALVTSTNLTLRQITRAKGVLTRAGDAGLRHHVRTYRSIRASQRSSTRKSLRDAGGRLLRDRSTSTNRRHLGRVSTTGN